LSALLQTQASLPLRITSDSCSAPISATRTLSGPEYHTRRVCEPDTSALRSALPSPPTPGSAGRPRSARSITVPDTPVRFAFCRSTSNCAGLRCGRLTLAEARSELLSTPAPRTATRTPAGTAHRTTGRDAITAMVFASSK
jgi:hypothetical protein